MKKNMKNNTNNMNTAIKTAIKAAAKRFVETMAEQRSLLDDSVHSICCEMATDRAFAQVSKAKGINNDKMSWFPALIRELKSMTTMSGREFNAALDNGFIAASFPTVESAVGKKIVRMTWGETSQVKAQGDVILVALSRNPADLWKVRAAIGALLYGPKYMYMGQKARVTMYRGLVDEASKFAGFVCDHVAYKEEVYGLSELRICLYHGQMSLRLKWELGSKRGEIQTLAIPTRSLSFDDDLAELAQLAIRELEKSVARAFAAPAKKKVEVKPSTKTQVTTGTSAVVKEEKVQRPEEKPRVQEDDDEDLYM